MRYLLYGLLIAAYSFFIVEPVVAADYNPMIYDNGWKALNEREISKKMQKPVLNINTGEPFNFKVIDKDNKEVGRVNTPMEYFNMGKGNSLDVYTTYDIIDEGLFRDVAVPLLYLSKARPSKYSYVRDFPFSKEDPLSVLPAKFVMYHGSDQREIEEKAIRENKSWRDIAPNSRTLASDSLNLNVYSTFAEDMYDLPEEERYHGEMASHCISPSVLGDFDGDGYEDMLLSCAYYYVEGTGRYYYFVVLTRKSQKTILEDITDKVQKLVWEK